jgi:hypothetical protein
LKVSQDGSNKGNVVDSVCLRNDGLRDGCDVGGVDRSGSLVNVISPCLDLKVFSREEPIPLNSYPSFAAKCKGKVLSLGIAESEGNPSSCEDFEEGLMALLTAIEVSHSQKELTCSSKLVNKVNRKLRRLSFCINYDSKGGSSNRCKVKKSPMLDSL